MRTCSWVAATGLLICVTAAAAADKIVHDTDNGFSLTFPEEWTKEAGFGESMRLKVKSGDHGLTCRVSVNRYDPLASGSPADPRAFMEKDWSPESWDANVGAGFDAAKFSNEKLIRFPDGYPARMADMDFRLGDSNSGFGHAKVVLSLRGDHFGLVTCGLASDSLEQTKRMWVPLADQAERVVSSFVLDEP
jgi:hypothetical protein